MIRRTHEILVDTGPRRLVYPRDTTFIRELNPALAKRWIAAGWDVDKTTLLELRHPTIPSNQPLDTGLPSELFAGLIFAWSRQVYFRVVVFTKNFFQHSKDDFLLPINVWHEKQQVITREEYVHNGTPRPTEDDIVRKEREFVWKTFGKKGYNARRANIQATINRLKDNDAIPGDVAVLWLREYFGTHQQKYTPVALPIPSTKYTKASHLAYSERIQNWVRAYDALDEDISKLFKYTLEDCALL